MESLIGKIEIIVLVIGFSILIVLYIIYSIMKKKRCNLEVKGKVVEKWTEKRPHTLRYPVYIDYILIEYEYEGKVYTGIDRPSPLGHIKKGDSVIVNINPQEPEECYEYKIDMDDYNERFTWKDNVIKLILMLPIISVIIVIILLISVDYK